MYMCPEVCGFTFWSIFLLSITVCWFLSDGSGGWCLDMNFSQNDKTINRDSKQAFRALVFAVNAHKYVLLNFEGKTAKFYMFVNNIDFFTCTLTYSKTDFLNWNKTLQKLNLTETCKRRDIQTTGRTEIQTFVGLTWLTSKFKTIIFTFYWLGSARRTFLNFQFVEILQICIRIQYI